MILISSKWMEPEASVSKASKKSFKDWMNASWPYQDGRFSVIALTSISRSIWMSRWELLLWIAESTKTPVMTSAWKDYYDDNDDDAYYSYSYY